MPDRDGNYVGQIVRFRCNGSTGTVERQRIVDHTEAAVSRILAQSSDMQEDLVVVFSDGSRPSPDGMRSLEPGFGGAVVCIRPLTASADIRRLGTDVLILALPMPLVAELAKADGIVFQPNLLSLGSDDRLGYLCRLIAMLCDDLDAGLPKDCAMVFAYLKAVVGFLLATHYGPEQHERQRHLGGMTLNQIRRVHLFVNDHVDEPIALDQLAGIAGMSRFHFSRSFKQATGVTPSQFITRRRIEAAIRSLRAGHRDLTVIALDCGFGSLQSFSRAFSRVTGLTPSEYRAALRTEIRGRTRPHDHRPAENLPGPPASDREDTPLLLRAGEGR